MKINNRGAASILVILIIVVLATFGGIALTAGWTNKQLAIKAAQSKVDYYAIDSVAEEMVAKIDNILFSVAAATEDYLNDLPDSAMISTDDKNGKLSTLFSYKTKNITSTVLKSKKVNEVFVRNYYYYCAMMLEEFALHNGMQIEYSNGFSDQNDFLNTDKTIPKTGSLIIKFTVTEGDGSGAKNIDIEIAVKAPKIQPKINNEQNWRTEFQILQKDNVIRYEILSWKLRQNPIEYNKSNPKFG